MNAPLQSNASLSSTVATGRPSGTLWQSVAGVAHSLQDVVTSAGTRTRVIQAGAGPCLVFLHGTGGHLEVFFRNLGFLADSHHVVAMDLLGHGQTDLPDDVGPFDWRTIAEHVLATMDSLGIKSATLVGEALGAQAAQWLAVNHPARVEAIVLCCACILPPEDADGPLLGKSQAAFHELTARVLQDPGSIDLMRERMTWLHLRADQVDDEMLGLRMTFWNRPGFAEAQRRLLASLRTARHDPRTSVGQAQLRQLDIPTLIVWTQHNPLFGLDSATQLTKYLPNAQCEVFTDSAMWPQFDEADKFNALLKSWLAA